MNQRNALCVGPSVRVCLLSICVDGWAARHLKHCARPLTQTGSHTEEDNKGRPDQNKSGVNHTTQTPVTHKQQRSPLMCSGTLSFVKFESAKRTIKTTFCFCPFNVTT